MFSVYLHTKDELFLKWDNLAWAVHLLRLQTSIYGFLTVLSGVFNRKKMFGEKSRKPLLVVVLVGLNPMFAHISNSIVNVNLNILFVLFIFLSGCGKFRLPTGKTKLNLISGLIMGCRLFDKDYRIDVDPDLGCVYCYLFL